jgi:hypothetical protein
MPILSSDVDHVRELLTQLNRSRYEFEQTRAHDESMWRDPGAAPNTSFCWFGEEHLSARMIADTCGSGSY